jgi:septal ring-binding cell division protein DamX
MAKTPRATLRFVDQLVLLVAWLVTCGLVYVLGYYVGKATPERQAAIEGREVRLPITAAPPAEGTRAKESNEFPSFYQALPGGTRPIDVARGAPVTPPQVAAATPTTVAKPTTTLGAGALAPPRPAAGSTTTVPARAAAPPATTTPPPRMAAAVVPPAGAAVPPSPPSETAALPKARGGFTVEANPTRSRSEAEELLVALRKRGYDAALVEVRRDGDIWYRLRVGRYATAAQATETMRKLRDSEGVTHAFVAAE